MYVSRHVIPERSLVRPRVVREEGGEAVLLEEVVVEALQASQERILWIRGRPWERTAAIRHLAAVLPANASAALFVDPIEKEDVKAAVPCKIGVYAGDEILKDASRYVLAGWKRDQWIEYLLAEHGDRCRSVMSRLLSVGPADPLLEIPELSQILLDEMAAAEDLGDPERALERFLARTLNTETKRTTWDQITLALLSQRCASGTPAYGPYPSHGTWSLWKVGCGRRAARLVDEPAVQHSCAASHMANGIRQGNRSPYLGLRLPYEVICRTAARIGGDAAARVHLSALVLQGEVPFSTNAAGVLVALDREWRPMLWHLKVLAGARLDGARWNGIELPGRVLTGASLRAAMLRESDLVQACLDLADLTGACLVGARLMGANARGAILAHADLGKARASRADLHESDLRQANLEGADLSHADLRKANLTGARCVNADLKSANLRGACVVDTDFLDADLERTNLSGLDLRRSILRGARLAQACLAGSNLAGLDLASADLAWASLSNADLTCAFMPGARMEGANLSDACLAGVNWEGADLRKVLLIGANFHLGANRGGKISPPIASEATRTGPDADDSPAPPFLAPEEIRVANLCEADLRGAKIDGVDFHLVDLRGAQLDPDQEEQARRCGAILGSRV